jgi:hypothetical protein
VCLVAMRCCPHRHVFKYMTRIEGNNDDDDDYEDDFETWGLIQNIWLHNVETFHPKIFFFFISLLAFLYKNTKNWTLNSLLSSVQNTLNRVGTDMRWWWWLWWYWKWEEMNNNGLCCHFFFLPSLLWSAPSSKIT